MGTEHRTHPIVRVVSLLALPLMFNAVGCERESSKPSEPAHDVTVTDACQTSVMDNVADLFRGRIRR